MRERERWGGREREGGREGGRELSYTTHTGVGELTEGVYTVVVLREVVKFVSSSVEEVGDREKP